MIKSKLPRRFVVRKPITQLLHQLPVARFVEYICTSDCGDGEDDDYDHSDHEAKNGTWEIWRIIARPKSPVGQNFGHVGSFESPRKLIMGKVLKMMINLMNA